MPSTKTLSFPKLSPNPSKFGATLPHTGPFDVARFAPRKGNPARRKTDRMICILPFSPCSGKPALWST
jgi:hypothetical protein